jgi:MFS superfamily sulfate permease-like transporter
MPMWERLKLFLNPIDGRYEDLRKNPWQLVVLRDFTAGLIVAMVAIPLAMGFAIASGLNPVHGIVGGAIAGLIGALFGGSKYQVYGPTAAYIPIILGIMATYGNAAMPSVARTEPEHAAAVASHPEYKNLTLEQYRQLSQERYAHGYGVLIFCSVIAGAILMIMGLKGLGSLVSKVPHSIVVGFTIGIALTIALTQIGDMLGYKEKIAGSFLDKVQGVWAYRDQFNVFALLLAVGTFLVTKYLLKISVFIPGPLIAIGVGYVLAQTLFGSQGLTVAQDKFGPIPTDDFLTVVTPVVPDFTSASVVFGIAFFVTAIVFVAAVESLLCSRMADRLADNQGIPYNPNKELWGQGMVNILVPLCNGFPHTGALARTATNIKVGAMTPLAGIFKCWLKLALAFFLAVYLNVVPMACIGGILAYVAFNMVKPAEVRQVLSHNRFHVGLMVYTAVMVLVTDFLTGVLSAIIIYAVLYRFLDKPAHELSEPAATGSNPEFASVGASDGKLTGSDPR